MTYRYFDRDLTKEELIEAIKKDQPERAQKYQLREDFLRFYNEEEFNREVERLDYYKACTPTAKSIYSLKNDDTRRTKYLNILVWQNTQRKRPLASTFTFRSMSDCIAVSSFKKYLLKKSINMFNLNPSTIVDPFAGWGQRAAASESLGLEYQGYDLRHYKEHEGLNIKQQDVFKLKDKKRYDLLFTCPPYFNKNGIPRELYEGDSIESEYNEVDFVLAALFAIPNAKDYVFVLSYDFPHEGVGIDSGWKNFKKKKNSDKMVHFKNEEIFRVALTLQEHAKYYV